jgi:hypothetical protein
MLELLATSWKNSASQIGQHYSAVFVPTGHVAEPSSTTESLSTESLSTESTHLSQWISPSRVSPKTITSSLKGALACAAVAASQRLPPASSLGRLLGKDNGADPALARAPSKIYRNQTAALTSLGVELLI